MYAMKPLNPWIKAALMGFVIFLAAAIWFSFVSVDFAVRYQMVARIMLIVNALALLALPAICFVASAIGWYKIDRKKQGGTLLAPVIIVLATLWLVLVVAAIGRARPHFAPDSTRLADITQLQQALDLYQKDNGHYPRSLRELTPKYLRVIPTDPVTHGQFSYRNSDTSYSVCAKLSSPMNGVPLNQNGEACLQPSTS
jgi:hypothetical protein